MRYLCLWLICYLQSKPKIGISAGAVSGGGIYTVTHFLTDDLVMKVVANIGICCSTVVAILSAIAWIIKTVRSFRSENSPKP